MKDKSLMGAIDRAQRACAAVLEVAPFRDDAETRRLAASAGPKHFATTVTPDSISIALVADEETVEVFRYTPSAPSTFPAEAA